MFSERFYQIIIVSLVIFGAAMTYLHYREIGLIDRLLVVRAVMEA